MKTILQWLQELPPGYRERATSQCTTQDTVVVASLESAIWCFAEWLSTKERHDFWSQVSHAIAIGGPLPPLPDDGHGGPRLEPEPQHTHSMNYSTTPVARPTLVYGEDVADMNEARTMQVIKALNAEVKDLSETGVTSRLIEQRIAERGAAINELVQHLDSFATPATPTA